MDSDCSHPPEDIPRGLALLAQRDVVLGSRYPDGTILGWPASRRAFSYCANLMARTLIDRGIHDYTNGYRFYTRRVVERFAAQPQRHKGYIYLSETLSQLVRDGARIGEFPIVFVNRRIGVSNTTPREIVTALTGLLGIAWRHRAGPRA